MEILLVVLICLASFRGTRLVTRDKFPLIAIPRDAFVERWGVYEDAKDKKISINGKRTNLFMRSLAYLWECDWCTGVWVSGAVVYAATFYVSVPYAVLVWLAASAVTGLLAQAEAVMVKKADES